MTSPEVFIARKYGDPEEVRVHREDALEGLDAAEEEMIRRWLPPPGPVLALGCGAGREVWPLVKRGFRALGLDLTKAMLAAARGIFAERLGPDAAPKVPLVRASLAALPFRSGSQRGVTLFRRLLQHLPGRERRVEALLEARRVLAPGGVALVSITNGLFEPGFLQLGLSYLRRWRGRGRGGPGAGGARPGSNDEPGILESIGALALSTPWNALRKLERILPEGLRGGGEAGDYTVSTVSRARSPGSIRIHSYLLEEAEEELDRAGFEVIDLLDDAAWKGQGAALPSRFRRRAFYLHLAARRRG